MGKFQLNEFAEEIQKEYQKKVEEALKRVEKIIYKKTQEIIKKHMIDNYYDGYTPKSYERTFQLPQSVGPYVEIGNIDGAFGITFGVEDEKPYGPSAMDHSRLKMTVTRKLKKTGKTVTRTYTYDLGESQQREERIFNSFLDGIHPQVGRARTGHVEKDVNKALDDFFDNKLNEIVLKELAKIK